MMTLAAQQAALERELRKLEPRLRKRFQVAIALLKKEINVRELADAISRGDLEYIERLFSDAFLSAAFTQYTDEIKEAQIKGAGLAISALPLFRFSSGERMEIRFNVTNPRTATFLESYSMNKVREVSNDIRRNIRTILNQSVLEGQNPLNAAKDLRAAIGLTSRQEAAVKRFRLNLINGDADVLQRQLRDRRFDRTIASALRADTNLSNEQVDKMTNRYRERYLQYRAQTIARTESIRALESGKDLLIRQKIEEGLIGAQNVKRFWIRTEDEKLRDSHRQIPEMNPDGVGIDEPFRSPLGFIMYPGDPSAPPENTINCRCTTFIKIESD